VSCCSGVEVRMLKIVRPMSEANLRGLRYSAVLDGASGLITPRRYSTRAKICIIIRSDALGRATGGMP
jgi:hypothetical protein